MRIGVPKETAPLERRVALTPDSVARLAGEGHQVVVETNAGLGASHGDGEYRTAGADISPTQEEVWKAPLVCVVRRPDPSLEHLVGEGSTVAGLLEPLDRPVDVSRLAETGAGLIAFELMPRTTRAQAMDALSSQATAAGYQAVILGAELSPRFLPMLTTAAGTVPPARVLVLGAGVAGLQAIATARRLGGRVSGYDVRAAAREQVESLGAAFVSLDLEAQDAETSGGYARELEEDDQTRQLSQLAEHVAKADLVVTTAAIPGKPAPLLVTTEMVEGMAAGSVIVDAAASTGGNCELTRPDEVVRHAGVTIVGPTDLPSRVASHASYLYGRNLVALINYLAGPEGLVLDEEDEIVSGSLVARNGRVVHPAVAALLAEAS